MAKKLTRTVFVDGVAYGPASAIPAAIAVRITNPKVWADADSSAPAPAGAVAGGAPADAEVPVPDAEATVKELREYAKAKGITLGAAKTKPEILKVLGMDDPDADVQGGEGDEDPEGADEDAADGADPAADGESAGADAE